MDFVLRIKGDVLRVFFSFLLLLSFLFALDSQGNDLLDNKEENLLLNIESLPAANEAQKNLQTYNHSEDKFQYKKTQEKVEECFGIVSGDCNTTGKIVNFFNNLNNEKPIDRSIEGKRREEYQRLNRLPRLYAD